MTLAVLVGSSQLPWPEPPRALAAQRGTPWGDASTDPQQVRMGDQQIVLLARHGRPHVVAPHAINYRANLWLLHELGVDRIVAVHTVGAIAAGLAVGGLVLPRQIIDYTWGRTQTFDDKLRHVDFGEPLAPDLCAALLAAAAAARVDLHDGGVYGCTQGPRLETAAEIDRMDRDGATVVGMTAMPEAALARELDIDYASVSLVVNPAAGRGATGAATIDRDALRAAGESGGVAIVAMLRELLSAG